METLHCTDDVIMNREYYWFRRLNLAIFSNSLKPLKLVLPNNSHPKVYLRQHLATSVGNSDASCVNDVGTTLRHCV